MSEDSKNWVAQTNHQGPVRILGVSRAKSEPATLESETTQVFRVVYEVYGKPGTLDLSEADYEVLYRVLREIREQESQLIDQVISGGGVVSGQLRLG